MREQTGLGWTWAPGWEFRKQVERWKETERGGGGDSDRLARTFVLFTPGRY